ncbi:diguanylate cyclase [Candidatus Dependentiae bacterium]|nr:diguanylate cyclase [Candidatus Dependentiae bacterium]
MHEIKINVLVVEDDESLNNLIKLHLEKMNCNVSSVDYAEKAIQLITKHYYDLFLIDINLKGVINGLKLLDYIKNELNLESEVIVITGNADIQTAVDAIKKGAYDLFEKPFSLLKLNEAIDKILHQKIIKRIPLNVLGIYKYNYPEQLNKNHTVLVVDDEEDIRNLVMIMLKEFNYEVITAESAKEAETLIKETRPDLIILDVMMPEEDGYTFGLRIKSNEKFFDIPILMLSAKGSDDDIKKGIDVCADDYMSKPFNQTVLMSKVKALLRMKNLIDEMKVYSNALLQKIEKQDLLRKYLSKETLFFSQLNKSLNLEEKSSLIKKLLPEILEIEMFSIFLVDGENLKIFAHNHQEICFEIPIDSIKESPMFKAISNQAPELIEDFNTTKFFKGKNREKYKKKSSIIFPLIIHHRCIGVINMNNRKIGEFDMQFLERATRLVEHISNSIENCLLFQKMEQMAIIDELTLTFNRRHFFYLLSNEIKKFLRYRHKFCVLMMDIDNFKKFNDTYGHINGDRMLRKFADVIKICIRDTDFFARYGGEEFVLLFPETMLDTAIMVAERLRRSVEKDCFIIIDNKEIGVTISGGLAEYKMDLTEEEFLGEADNYLYYAKRNGKNQIISMIEV